MEVVVFWIVCTVVAALIGGVLRQNPVGGFALGMGFGPLGVVLAYFLEGDEPAA